MRLLSTKNKPISLRLTIADIKITNPATAFNYRANAILNRGVLLFLQRLQIIWHNLALIHEKLTAFIYRANKTRKRDIQLF